MPACTRMRLAQTQVWPALRNFEAIAPATACVEIGVVEDDERRVAAELEGQLLDVSAHCAIEHAADLGRAGERQLAHALIGRQRLADRAGIGGDDVEDARRHARIVGELRRAPAPKAASPPTA